MKPYLPPLMLATAHAPVSPSAIRNARLTLFALTIRAPLPLINSQKAK